MTNVHVDLLVDLDLDTRSIKAFFAAADQLLPADYDSIVTHSTHDSEAFLAVFFT